MNTAAKRRYVLLSTTVAAFLGIGVLIGLRINLNRATQLTTPVGRPPILTEITVATLLRPEQEGQPDPALKQQINYATDDPLALRITTDPSIQEPVEVGVRLMNEEGEIIGLDPPSFTIAPGTTTTCCWKVKKEGTYLLQILRPEKLITSVPLIIVKKGGGPAERPTIRLF